MSAAMDLIRDSADFAMSDFADIQGLSRPVYDREDAGFLMMSALADDLELDATEIDLDDLG